MTIAQHLLAIAEELEGDSATQRDWHAIWRLGQWLAAGDLGFADDIAAFRYAAALAAQEQKL